MASQDDIVSLVRLAKAGDQEAFADLVLLFERNLCGYLTTVVRDRDEALDCAQITFWKGWQKLGTLKDETKFKPWLYTTARRVAYDCLRRRRDICLESWEELATCNSIESSSRVEEQVTQATLLHLALDQLPPKLRECFCLDAAGCSRDEIAQILELTPDSVTTYMCLARRQLRQAYSRLEQE